MRILRIILLAAFSCLFAINLCADSLMPCPDCGELVSPRAVMCPHCGCPGEAIKEAATIREEEKDSQTLYPLVRIETDQTKGFGVAARQDTQRFILLDHHLLESAQSLKMTRIATNAPVAYKNLEIAANEPLARFETSSTNLVYLAVSWEADAAGADLVCYRPRAESVEVSTNTIAQVPTQTLCVADANTNLVRMAAGSYYTTVTPQTEWIAVQPGEFRRQTQLLNKAEAAEDGMDGETRKQIEQTEWLTPYLEKRAERVFENRK